MAEKRVEQRPGTYAIGPVKVLPQVSGNGGTVTFGVNAGSEWNTLRVLCPKDKATGLVSEVGQAVLDLGLEVGDWVIVRGADVRFGDGGRSFFAYGVERA